MAALGLGGMEGLLAMQEDGCRSRPSGRQCPVDVPAGSYSCCDTAVIYS